MTYDQTKNLFKAMDNLETYAKMYQREMDKDDTDWNEVHRYGNLIKVSRKRIFDVVEAPHD